jgi:electron transport complex protein RnfA
MSVLFLLAAGIGYTLMMLVFSSVQMKLENSDMADSFRGIPILLISCALAALAFSGFYGLSF